MALDKNLIDKIYLTRIHHTFEGDTFFPQLDDSWNEIERKEFIADENHAHNYSFLTLEKKIS